MNFLLILNLLLMNLGQNNPDSLEEERIVVSFSEEEVSFMFFYFTILITAPYLIFKKVPTK